MSYQTKPTTSQQNEISEPPNPKVHHLFVLLEIDIGFRNHPKLGDS